MQPVLFGRSKGLGHVIRIGFLALGLLLAAGCGPKEFSLEGRACDTAHPCVDGWQCVQAVCVKGPISKADTCVSSLEICDGVDNNCDGAIDNTQPSAPPALDVVETTTGSITLAWVPVDRADLSAYEISRANVVVGMVSATQTRFVDLVGPGQTFTYSIRAVDRCGSRSAVASVTATSNVGPANAPTVALTSPANGTTYNAPASITMNATAAAGTGRTLARVEFFQGTTLLCSDTTSPYSCSWNNVSGGSYSLVAIAIDTGGLNTTSNPISVTIEIPPPTVVITSPANGASFTAPASITINATAAAGSGRTLTEVEFFRGATMLCSDTTSPYSCVWNSPTVGTHSLTAVATDNAGASRTSAAISVSVTASTSPLLIGDGSVWKYVDTGVDLGTSWRSTGFNDTAWPSGGAELGYGDGDETTVISFGPNDQNVYVTSYFRKTFSVSDPSAFSQLALNLKADDGAVVYINGVEVVRWNMPTGTINYRTWAPLNSYDDGLRNTFNVSPSVLVSGTNTIAVEVHQSTPDSSDVSFDLSLTGS